MADISIHALRKESDLHIFYIGGNFYSNFNPRSP